MILGDSSVKFLSEICIHTGAASPYTGPRYAPGIYSIYTFCIKLKAKKLPAGLILSSASVSCFFYSILHKRNTSQVLGITGTVQVHLILEL